MSLSFSGLTQVLWDSTSSLGCPGLWVPRGQMLCLGHIFFQSVITNFSPRPPRILQGPENKAVVLLIHFQRISVTFIS